MVAAPQERERLVQLGRATGEVAHDFGNVLAVVLNYAELLRPALEGAEPAADLARIRRAAEQGVQLVDRLRGLAAELADAGRAADRG